VGIRTASIHYYFPTKEDLGVAWAAWYQESMLKGEVDLSAEYPDVRQRLMALASSIAACAGSGEKSCPISLLQAEYAVLPPRLQKAVRALIDQRLSILARWLESGRREGSFSFKGSAEIQAQLVWAVLEYGTQLERSHPSRTLPALVKQLVDNMSS
jgi:TetR/AcrR family transcriptional repressor of nem operon